MISRIAWLLTCLMLCTPAVEHQMPQGYRCPEGSILADDLTTRLEVPDKPVVLGSGWVVHYVIHNRGGLPLVVNPDWHDDIGPRSTRVWLEAVGPDGAFAADSLAPTKLPGAMGGASGVNKPGRRVRLWPQAMLSTNRFV